MRQKIDTHIRSISKTHWNFYQFLEVECSWLLSFMDRHIPLWSELYHHAYYGESVADIKTSEGIPVMMVPFNLWKNKFRPEEDMYLAIYMLCTMGLLGIEENDLCDKQEWIFYTLEKDFKLAEWYCKILEGGAKKTRASLTLLNWIRENFKHGCTFTEMVCGDDGGGQITVGNPGKLDKLIFRRRKS